MKFCQIRIVQGTCIARGLVRESSILEESKWFVSPYRVSISGPSDQRKPIEKGGGQGGTTSLLLPYPISALYILNHFAFALYAYRLRGKRLKKAAADSGEEKREWKRKRTCVRGGGERKRRAKNIFDVRGPSRLDFISYTDMADLATVRKIHVCVCVSVMYRCWERRFMTARRRKKRHENL